MVSSPFASLFLLTSSVVILFLHGIAFSMGSSAISGTSANAVFSSLAGLKNFLNVNSFLVLADPADVEDCGLPCFLWMVS